ncbi:acyltransferase family protein [Serratia aquatilis]|uniref:Acyltransferase family protein n=1 Tax=Serratia aquatilis TaxID=1737515 RepID=A0ABV6EJV4_9GAMM
MTNFQSDVVPIVTSKKESRLNYIDSLRGLSAILVVFSHAYFFLTINHFFINIGKVGVFVFFLISGFVIPFSFKKGPGSYKVFITTRFFRLYPAYWASMIIAVLIYFIFDGKIPGFKEVVSNLTMFQMGIGQPNIIGVYWTLFIELIFYIVCIFLAWRNILWDEKGMIKTFYFFSLLSILVSVARFFLHMKFPVAVPLGLSLMFLGCAWRFFLLEGSEYVKSKIIKMIVFCIVTTFLSSYLSYSWDIQAEEPWQNFAFAYSIGIVTFAILTKFVRINSTLMCFLGSISYSLYLVHDPVIHLFRELNTLFLIEYSTGYRLPAIIASIAIAFLLYVVVEKPSISIGRNITKRIKASCK